MASVTSDACHAVCCPPHSLVAGMRVVVDGMIEAIPRLVAVIVLVAFSFLLFGIIALQLFSGLFHARCRLTPCVQSECLSVPACACQRLVALPSDGCWWPGKRERVGKVPWGFACAPSQAQHARTGSTRTRHQHSRDPPCTSVLLVSVTP